MGLTPSCQHPSKTIIKTIPLKQSDSVLWKGVIEICECNDCPEKWRQIVWSDHLTSRCWSISKIDASSCDHSQFSVIDSTVEIVKKNQGFVEDIASIALTLVARSNVTFSHYECDVECDLCGQKLRASSKMIDKWQNHEKTTVPGEWHLKFNNVPDTKHTVKVYEKAHNTTR